MFVVVQSNGQGLAGFLHTVLTDNNSTVLEALKKHKEAYFSLSAVFVITYEGFRLCMLHVFLCCHQLVPFPAAPEQLLTWLLQCRI